MHRTVIAVLLLLGLTALAFSQDRATFTVGTASAGRGQKAAGTIEVPAAADAALTHRADSKVRNPAARG